MKGTHIFAVWLVLLIMTFLMGGPDVSYQDPSLGPTDGGSWNGQ